MSKGPKLASIEIEMKVTIQKASPNFKAIMTKFEELVVLIEGEKRGAPVVEVFKDPDKKIKRGFIHQFKFHPHR